MPRLRFQPRVVGLDDPATRRQVGSRTLGLQALRDGQLTDRVVPIATVQAQPLELVFGGDRAGDRSRLERGLQQLDVVTMSPFVREPDRDLRALGEDRTFPPHFPPGLWGLGRSSGRPAVLWSSRRRPPETTSRSPGPRRTPTAPGARSHERPRPAPTPVLSTSMIASIASRSGSRGR